MGMAETPLVGLAVGAMVGTAGAREGAEVFNLSDPGQTHPSTRYASSSTAILVSKQVLSVQSSDFLLYNDLFAIPQAM